MKYFTIDELTRSAKAKQLGIRNKPDRNQIDNMRLLVDKVLDSAREMWGKPLNVNSGYRCPTLNKAVGGTANSSHMYGQAADITAGGSSENRRLYNMIKRSTIPFTKMIFETNARGVTWVHISYDGSRHAMRATYIYDPRSRTYKTDKT